MNVIKLPIQNALLLMHILHRLAKLKYTTAHYWCDGHFTSI